VWQFGEYMGVYLGKFPTGQNPSFGQGWCENPEGQNNLPWRLAGGRGRMRM